MVTTENYEEYLMMQADGELDAQELAALQAFLEAHPEIAAEASAWQDVKLVPDEMIRYEHTRALLREERKAVAFRPWHIALPAAAALLLALLIIRNPKETTHQTAALHTAPETRLTETPKSQAPQPATGAMPVKNPPVPVRTIPRPRRAMLATNMPRRISTPAPARRAETLSGLDAQSFTILNVESIRASEPKMLAMTEPVRTSGQSNAARQGLNVQFASANAEALSLVREGLDQRIEQIGRAAKAVRETAVVIKFGSNAFHINF
jgi:hypothetical protein